MKRQRHFFLQLADRKRHQATAHAKNFPRPLLINAPASYIYFPKHPEPNLGTKCDTMPSPLPTASLLAQPNCAQIRTKDIDKRKGHERLGKRGRRASRTTGCAASWATCTASRAASYATPSATPRTTSRAREKLTGELAKHLQQLCLSRR